MSFIIYFLVVLLVLTSVFLALLILVQLPKKDAGAGLAFGGGTADALFGAGSGTALTKITKWVTIAFVLLAVILGALVTRVGSSNHSEFESGVEQQQQMQAPAQQPHVAPQPTTPPPASAPSAAPALPLYSATNNAPTHGK